MAPKFLEDKLNICISSRKIVNGAPHSSEDKLDICISSRKIVNGFGG
ncbi:hypothetical protein NIES4071_69980 [Calothrix sp. NIES-4071]|nr:hypothetical protein NIES4071_69980 [Calothrix sp. NIES-4071]BAZ61275.1 hypothetical protein NIES4105_69930 [Calothrix sp. NIES-4105]